MMVTREERAERGLKSFVVVEHFNTGENVDLGAKRGYSYVEY